MDDSERSQSLPVQTGDIVTLRVESLASGGDFVGRVDGFTVFVRGAAPSESVRAEITEVHSTFARARLVSIESPSPDRIEPECAVCDACGGCDLQHVYYPAQLAQKHLLVRALLQRIGGFGAGEIECPPVVGMDNPWQYRNKAEYFAGRDDSGEVLLGFQAKGGRNIVPVEECCLQHPLNEEVRRAVQSAARLHAAEADEKESLLRVVSRVSFAQEKACVTLVTGGRPNYVAAMADEIMRQVPEVGGVCHSRTRSRRGAQRAPAELVVGTPYLTESIGDSDFRLSPDSFFQINPRQTLAMTNVIKSFAGVGEEEILIEGYCGVGTFLLPIGAGSRQATGIESESSAVADAKVNIRKKGLHGVRIYEGKVEQVLSRFAARNWHAAAVVLDPPRKGCGQIVIKAAASLQPRALVLASCDPATLARDLRYAADLGYAPRTVQIIDMFPQTWHTESIALCVPERGR